MPFRVCLLLILLCSHALPAAAQSKLRVPAQYPSIQAAIDVARAGDTILVAPGRYLERIDFRGRDLTVISSHGPAQTVIDGGGVGTVVQMIAGETRAAVLDGFTITGGVHALYAGGVHVAEASPTLRNNRILDNRGGRHGHGLSLLRSPAALIIGNQISLNRSFAPGNGSGGGGGIGVTGAGQVEIRANQITANRVDRHSSGGGINLVDAGAPRIVANVIDANTARLHGAGIAIIGRSAAVIENNLISHNQLTEPGYGGAVSWLLPPGANPLRLVNNTLAFNQAEVAAGLHADGDDGLARVANNLVLVNGDASAIECGDMYDGTPPLLDHNNAVSAGEAYAGLCAEALGREGNFSRVEALSAGDYGLLAGSVNIDAGDDSAASEAFDLVSQARHIDGDHDHQVRIDIGAYEYHNSPLDR